MGGRTEQLEAVVSALEQNLSTRTLNFLVPELNLLVPEPSLQTHELKRWDRLLSVYVPGKGLLRRGGGGTEVGRNTPTISCLSHAFVKEEIKSRYCE